MNHLFPYDNIVAGLLVLIVGFVFHWIGQVLCTINWELGTRLGLQETGMPKEYKVYEHAAAAADSLIGWIYGIIALGLFLNAPWAYKLAWIPGVVFLYHSLNYWFWNLNRNRDGNQLTSNSVRILWTFINFSSGLLIILVAWNAG